ncbi:MAG: DUF3795 domain-containing protein [Lachnospiraceae bacterium]|nr:DUF3795 domain-containing protein [Lachnospiraceae bacterium]
MENSNQSKISVCGTDCGTCSCYGDLCNGCSACEGKVFHSPEGCAIYTCVAHEKNLKNCGACKALPCDKWRAMRDPKFSDEAFEQNIAGRVKTLQELG